MRDDKFMLDQLNQIDKKLDDLAARMVHQEASVGGVQRTVDKCEKLLSGNSEPERGILIRLDRAEQTIDRQKKIGWVLLTAAVGQLIERFVH